MAGLHFEEFFEGQEFIHDWSRTVTEMDNTMFSLLTMNPQPQLCKSLLSNLDKLYLFGSLLWHLYFHQV